MNDSDRAKWPFPDSSEMAGAEELVRELALLIIRFSDAGNASRVPYNGGDASFVALAFMLMGAAGYSPERLHHLIDTADYAAQAVAPEGTS